MKQMVLLFALVACSLASPAVTSYSFSEISPYYAGVNHMMPSFYKAFPYMASSYYSPYVSTPYVASAYMATPYVSTPYVKSPYFVPGTPIKTQYHKQDIAGQAVYGHSELGQVHHAVQDASGNKAGMFSHVLPDGSVSHTDYVADSMGYRVTSNALPIAPVHYVAPVADTVEVVAARAAHLAEVEKVKSRSKRAIPYVPTQFSYSTYPGTMVPNTYYNYPRFSNYGYSTPYVYGSHYNTHFY